MFRRRFARRRLSRAADPRHVGRSPGEAVERLEGRTLLAVFTVTSTADDGPGSLRQAILDANANTTTDTITFNIPGAGVVHTIAPLSPLPRMTGISTSNTIDGTTQPGFAGVPLIELNGSAAGGGADGLSFEIGTVRGLVINRFRGSGVVISNGGIVQASYIGTDATGTVALGNSRYGVWAGGFNVMAARASNFNSAWRKPGLSTSFASGLAWNT